MWAPFALGRQSKNQGLLTLEPVENKYTVDFPRHSVRFHSRDKSMMPNVNFSSPNRQSCKKNAKLKMR